MSEFTVSSDTGITATVVTANTLQATVISASSNTFSVSGALAGPTGATGPTGPAGTTDYTLLTNKPTIINDKNYIQPFTAVSTVSVTHNLGKYPAVTVIDSAGDECVGSVNHVSTNQLTVNFSASFSGTVYCN